MRQKIIKYIAFYRFGVDDDDNDISACIEIPKKAINIYLYMFACLKYTSEIFKSKGILFLSTCLRTDKNYHLSFSYITYGQYCP